MTKTINSTMNAIDMHAIVTVPPYATFLKEVVEHPIVSGIRLNTVMPIKEPLEVLLGRLGGLAASCDKQLWIDLKCRQLRIKGYGVPPFTEIELSHDIEVDCPTWAYFGNGNSRSRVLAIDKNRLIMEDGPRRVVGPGESVNIPDESLKINGYLTSTDEKYIAAATKNGLHNFILSFVEQEQDLVDVRKLDPAAQIIAKIESRKGLAFAKTFDNSYRLMTARGDLYAELEQPHEILLAQKKLIAIDPRAILASRILPSLENSLHPQCQDLTDVYCAVLMGYKTFMLGDDICMRRDSTISALNILQAIHEDVA